MYDLVEEDLLARKSRLETSFMSFALDRHPQDVGGALQKADIVGNELVL
jgi:hypothetical protein